MPRKSYWKGEEGQKKIKNYIDDYWKKNYRAPTIRDIMDGANIGSLSTTFLAVNHLEESKAIITRDYRVKYSNRQIIPTWVVSAINSVKGAKAG